MNYIKTLSTSPDTLIAPSLKLVPMADGESFPLHDASSADSGKNELPTSLMSLSPLQKALQTSAPKISKTTEIPPLSLHVYPYRLHLHSMVEDDFFRILQTLRYNSPFYCVVEGYQLKRLRPVTREFLSQLETEDYSVDPFIFEGVIDFLVIGQAQEEEKAAFDLEGGP